MFNIMSSYFTLKESYEKGKFTNQYVYSQGPQNNQWRQNPFSNKTLIKPNVAGYYPYKSELVQTKPIGKEYEYKYYYPCSTIFPRSPELVKSGGIIHQP